MIEPRRVIGQVVAALVRRRADACVGCGESPAIDANGLCGHCHWLRLCAV